MSGKDDLSSALDTARASRPDRPPNPDRRIKRRLEREEREHQERGEQEWEARRRQLRAVRDAELYRLKEAARAFIGECRTAHIKPERIPVATWAGTQFAREKTIHRRGWRYLDNWCVSTRGMIFRTSRMHISRTGRKPDWVTNECLPDDSMPQLKEVVNSHIAAMAKTIAATEN